MGKKVQELRTKAKKDLIAELEELKKELSQLRVAQVTNGAASKLGKIGHVRKNVARVLTVLNQKSMSDFQKQASNLKRVPKQLRAKLTRAKRRALTPAQANKKTVRQQKKESNFAVRKFALKA